MKPLKLLFTILSLFILKAHIAVGQTKLPTGLYKLENKAAYALSLNGKVYHTNGQPFAYAKNIKVLGITQDRSKKDFYNLNLQLDAEVIKYMKMIQPAYGSSVQVGIVVDGKLIAAPIWMAPITTFNVSVSNKSKAELGQISEKLKSETARK